MFGGRVCLAGLVIAAATLLLKLRFWPFELFHHFLFHYLLLSGFLAVMFLVLRAKVAVACSVALFCVLGGLLWNVYSVSDEKQYSLIPSPGDGLEGFRVVTLITHNIWELNTRRQEVGAWLQSQPADVVLLQEVPPRVAAWYREKSFYPYQLEIYDPVPGHAGFPPDKAIVILSRYPLATDSKLDPSKEFRPMAIVRISIPDVGNTWVVAVHAQKPTTPTLLARRDQFLLGAAREIGGFHGSVVVAGDFNATPFTPVFGDFLRLAGLSVSRPYTSTFPAKLRWLGIPIDHILVRHVRVADIEALPAIGSDHRPLKATLRLPERVLGTGRSLAFSD